MNDLPECELLKRNVGDFILTFSEIEFSIGILVSYLENGLDINPLIPEIVGLNLDDKKKHVRSKLIDKHVLLQKWSIIEGKLSDCNTFRKYIAHGIVSSQASILQSLIKVKPKNGIEGFNFKEITNNEVQKKLEKLKNIAHGENGLIDFNVEIKEMLSKKACV